MFVCNDFSLEYEASAEQDVELVRRGANFVYNFAGLVLLLTEVAIQLLDVLRRP